MALYVQTELPSTNLGQIDKVTAVLQAAPQQAWSGKAENVAAAQKAYYHRAKVTAAARRGEYSAAMEKEAAGASA